MAEPNVYSDPDDLSVRDIDSVTSEKPKDKKGKKQKKGQMDNADDVQSDSPKQKKQTKLQRMAEDLDYIERDPKKLNDSCQVGFDDVIGEPVDTHSKDGVWVTVYKGYYAGQICCGTCLQYVCAVPCSFLWGCCFSLLAFMQVYHMTPCIRAFNILFSCFSRIYATIVLCCCVPVYESCALLFTKIHVTWIPGTEGYKDRKMSDMNLMNRV